MPKVSVIVPVFNCEAFLRPCLDSILSQTFRDFELILIDDGSTDRSGQILDEYASIDERIRVIHRKNGGQSAARNAGLDAASGELIYFSDSDDILEPSLLETVVPEFDQGYELVAFCFDRFPFRRKLNSSDIPVLRERKELLLTTDQMRYSFLTGDFRMRAIRWEVWNRLFRRDLIEKWHIRFPSDRRAYPEDLFFNYCYVAHVRRILMLPDCLYHYRRRADSVSDRSRQDLMIRTSSLIAEALRQHYRSSVDCRYLAAHFLPIYYLLHKGAVRRLRRYQWNCRLTIDDAREILQNELDDDLTFQSRMRRMFCSPVVVESYRKDRGALLQFTDRLYTAELLELPSPGIICCTLKAILSVLSRFNI